MRHDYESREIFLKENKNHWSSKHRDLGDLSDVNSLVYSEANKMLVVWGERKRVREKFTAIRSCILSYWLTKPCDFVVFGWG